MTHPFEDELQRGFIVTVLDEHGNYIGDIGAKSLLAALRQARDEEREACALIAENEIPERLTGDALIVMETAETIAAAIRARRKQP